MGRTKGSKNKPKSSAVDPSSFFEEVDASTAKERRLARKTEEVSEIKVEESSIEEVRKRRIERLKEKESIETKSQNAPKKSGRSWKGKDQLEGLKTSPKQIEVASREPSEEDKKAISYFKKNWTVCLNGDKVEYYADGKKVMESSAKRSGKI